MDAVLTGTLAKWGNSQGVRIPKDICDQLGLRIGSTVDMRVDQAKSEVTLTFPRPERKYARNRTVSLAELCEGWSGGKVGEEWSGADVGAEVVE